MRGICTYTDISISWVGATLPHFVRMTACDKGSYR